MGSDQRLALHTAAAAASLGLAGDHLFRAAPWGLNAAVWVAALAALTVALVRERDGRLTRDFVALSVLGAFFAACIAWRDAPMLVAWNVLGSLLCVALAGLAAGPAHLPITPLTHYLRRPPWTAWNVALGPVVLAGQEVNWQGVLDTRRFGRLGPIGVGMAVATPLLLVFGGLLGSADPVFERMLRSLFDWDVPRLLGHVTLFAVIAWLAAGLIRSVLARPGDARSPRVPGLPLGLVELAIPLALLAALFLAFDIVQARYLFGGDELIQTTVGLTYAEYARRGFFELVAVSGLVLPVLLAADGIARCRDRRTRAAVRALIVVHLTLVGLIMASAMLRMRLYVDVYGLSLDRIYASAVMIWVAATLLWFALTVLRDRRERFGFGTIVAGLAVLAGLNLANPDGLVARVNVDRATAAELDVEYLGRLSADATPTLLAALDRLDRGQACALAARLEARTRQWDRTVGDWRSWNLARARAVEAIQRHAPVGSCPRRH